MNLLAPSQQDMEYGSTSMGEVQNSKQESYRRCSKKTSVLMSLLACVILAIGMFVWFKLVAANSYGRIDNIDESDDIPPGLVSGGGGLLGDMLLNDDNIDYKLINNDDWRILWINLGYDKSTVDNIDFYTYSMLGVNYQKIYQDIINHNHPITKTAKDATNHDQIGKTPLFDDCSCNYCMGFCENVYCPICMRTT